MATLFKRGLILAAICVATSPCRADEIRLKDGKKLYGVIVAYEENMFKVKTDFGYVLVEKDKIASIIPTASGAGESGAGAKTPGEPAKSPATGAAKNESPGPSATDAKVTGSNVSAKTSAAATDTKREKAAVKIASSPVKPELPAPGTTTEVTAPAIKTGSATSANASIPATAGSLPPAPPKEPEPPAIREDVQGNLYTNYTNGFRMYKAPSWQLMNDARNALPNAIVAMGTANESSLMVVGREKTKEPLDAAAVTVEKRLYDVYENYHRVSLRKTSLGGSPAVEFRYRGKADEHDWSGTLMVIARGGDIFTVLGMTYADSDLIQIQENVIAKAIGSFSFEVAEVKK